MQYRVYDRQALTYKDGGYVQSYSIDDDYISNNNSTFSVVKKTIAEENTLTDVVVGDIVVLIQDSGPYHKGVITAVDNTAMTISYKGDKELFNDNMINPFRAEFLDSDVKAAGKFGLAVVVEVLKNLFVTIDDKYKQLPVTFITSGDVLDEDGMPKMIWSWSNDSIKTTDWLVSLFEDYNVSLAWTIDFNISEQNIRGRKARYICTLSAITNSGGIIKDNVDMQTIAYTTQELPEATVCIVIDSNSKEILNMSSGKNLLNPAAAEENKYIQYEDGYIRTDERSDSDISGYIRIRPSTDKNPNDFTFSQEGGDSLKRYIMLYNDKQKVIGYLTYQRESSTNKFAKTFNVNSFTIIGASDDEQIAERRKAARWFRICYCNTAKNLQVEKGDAATDYDPFDIPSIFYLYEKDGVYSVETKSDILGIFGKFRVLPVRTVIATYDSSSTDDEGVTPITVAKEKLMPSEFNQFVQIKINADSKMFDFENAKFGDRYKIINENGTIDSVYSGQKRTSADKWVTLYFGLGRQNYTDIQQKRMRKQRYNEVYNLGVR